MNPLPVPLRVDLPAAATGAPPLRLAVHPGADPVSQALRAHGVWEPFETQVFLSLLRPGDTVVDVGAHVGYYTALAARAAGPTGFVHALEPAPDNLMLLRDNVGRNGLANVMVHALAATDATGTATLHLDAVNTGDHRLYASTGEPRPGVAVGTTSLDALLAVQHGIRLIKIDAQGSELGIFRGMAKLLARRVPDLRIISEVWPHGLRQAGGSHAELLALMSAHGFQASLIHEATQRLEPLSYETLAAQLDTSWYAEHRGFVNVLLG